MFEYFFAFFLTELFVQAGTMYSTFPLGRSTANETFRGCVGTHSALGYRSPEEFEREVSTGVNSAGATMSFFRHGEIYQSDVGGNSSGERPKSRPPTHRSDESPAGYSSASCSPAELTSASPAERHPEREKEKRKFEKEKSLNCMCANSKLSQQRGSPHNSVPSFVPTPELTRMN
jgi:hypothetical protein